MSKHVVHLSGGDCSWAAARRVADTYGTDDMVLLFADTKVEDHETYSFLQLAAINIGVPLTIVAEGRDPWQVFEDVRFVGNSRVDPCSKILKRDLLDRYCTDHFDPATTIRYVGIHWSESDRFDGLRDRMAAKGWTFRAPLCEKPFMGVQDIVRARYAAGLPEQWAYRVGLPHANCLQIGCVKGGQAYWAKLHAIVPAVYESTMLKEDAAMERLGSAATILNDRRGGIRVPMSLRKFQERIRTGDYDRYDFKACACFSGATEQ